MELKRKAYARLLEWKNRSNGSTALLIDGARRVGKSHLAGIFGKNEYKSFMTIDFSNVSPMVKDIFENDTADFDLFFNKLSVITGTVLHKRESLVVFDEVQRFPRARELIKHLVADGRYDYIETGSLISIKRNIRDIVIPSEEEHLSLDPLDFEEFLWAMGDESTVPFIKSSFENTRPLGDAVHRKIMNQFRQYVLVGGMPQAVTAYVKEKDFAAADRAKKMILNLYRQDITRFAEGYEMKVLAVFDLIPSQLSKKEKKFNITSLGKSAKTRTYEDSFMWLADGMIINQCFLSTDPAVGLAMNLDSVSQKCYMADTGLLVTHSLADDDYIDNPFYKSVLLDKLGINEGMLMENIVAQMLRANGHKLFFYSRNDSKDRSNTMEIDFLIKKKKAICPVEVKSSSYRKHSSLDKFCNRFKGRIGQPYVICTKDLKVDDGVIYIPIYMTLFL
jgi:predicted AAA+ superfamily ATPase